MGLEPPPVLGEDVTRLAGHPLGAVRVGQLDVLLVAAVDREIAAVEVQDRDSDVDGVEDRLEVAPLPVQSA